MTMRQFKSKKETVNEGLDKYFKNLLRREVLTWKEPNAWEGDLHQIQID